MQDGRQLHSSLPDPENAAKLCEREIVRKRDRESERDRERETEKEKERERGRKRGERCGKDEKTGIQRQIL